MEEGNPSLFSAFHAYTEIADNLCPTLGRCAMYETLNEKELCKILDTDSKTGLAQEEAEKRLKSQGENVLKKGKEKTFWDMVQEQINDPMIFILFVAAAISMLLREFSDTGIILAVILLNTAIGVFQEGKAVKAMEALKKITAPRLISSAKRTWQNTGPAAEILCFWKTRAVW